MAAQLEVMQIAVDLRMAEAALAQLGGHDDDLGGRRRSSFSARLRAPLRRSDATALRGQIDSLRGSLQQKRERVRAMEEEQRTQADRPATTIYRLHSETKFVTMSENEYRESLFRQRRAPLLLDDANNLSWWWFADRFWLDPEGLRASEIRELVLERDTAVARNNDSSRQTLAITARDVPPAVEESEEPIPEIVRRAVWRRDRGQCVACGGEDDLVFDLIVPTTRGGSINPMNVELRCRTCR